MTSNILSGERRWASARRTGMTVLGKVSVPKPLNLPSQRLENHGVDRNVDIVPKGSIGWGSRPSSSSASNPWGSSTLSPNGDGSVSSPSHLSGRPSSGGTGSRPSTAGSERTHERSGNAWGPSSRPSSASGTSVSNKTSLTSLRPHSAETRPSSSQLSRFAEPMLEPLARSPVGTAKRVILTSSDNETFSLTSGDFPTLSSSKESSSKNSESLDQGSHSRPSSASSGVAQKKEWTETSPAGLSQSQYVNTGTVNTWKRDGPQNAGEGFQPSMDKWHGEPQYHNANIPSPQFDAWCGPPMNAPGGVWYRGPPPGPRYGPPVSPSGFPVEPFPYYCPQMPPAALANSQSVAGPRGPRPKNGEMFRPQLPDAFVRPGMPPFRPGFYPGPMPYEGYYGPPMGYCNSNGREVPFTSKAGGPSVYNRYPAPNPPDTGHSQARTIMSGSTGKTLPNQFETVRSDDAPGQYKFILKQNHEWDAKERGENREFIPTSNSTFPKKGGQLGTSFHKNEWGADHSSEDEMYPSNTQFGNSSNCTVEDRHNPDTVQVDSWGSGDDMTVENSRVKKSEPSSHGMIQPSSASGRGLAASASTLIQKIEGLNEKVRASDGRNDGICTSRWEEQKGVIGFGTHDMGISSVDKTSQLTSAPRRQYEGVGDKHIDNGKRRYNGPDVDGWQRKPISAEAAYNIHVTNVLALPNVQQSRINPSVTPLDNPSGTSEGESLIEELDSTDGEAQRAKMRELAKQRAMQLQKEEEERIREQKAKAFAKLEELNQRTQGVNSSNMTAENALPTGVSQHEKEGSQTHVDSASNTDTFARVGEGTGEWSSEAAVPVSDLPIQTSSAAPTGPVVLPCPVLPLKQEIHNFGNLDCKAIHENEAGASRDKRNSHKPKQNTPSQKESPEKFAAIVSSKPTEKTPEVAVDVIPVVAPAEVGSGVESSLPSISNGVVESSAHNRRKTSRISKNKHKLDSTPSVSALPLTMPNENNPVEVSTETEICKASESDLDSVAFGTGVAAGVGTESSDQPSSLQNEGSHSKFSNQRKPQQSRRFSKNQQSNRFVDKYHGNDNVMWAPVRSQSKPEFATEMDQKPVQESVTSMKNDNQAQYNLKSKRAEMERYVPKPVAKELAQQSGVLQTVPSSVGPSTSGEKAESQLLSGNLQPGSSVTEDVLSIAESQDGQPKDNKQSKVHGAGRQRGPMDSVHVKGLQNLSSSSTSSRSASAQVSRGQNESVKTELTSVKSDRKVSREFSASEAGNMTNDSTAAAPAPVISPHRRYQGVTGKGKRYPSKGERNKVNDSEHEKNSKYQESNSSRTQLGGPSINQVKKASSGESRSLEERTSPHWQPKSNSVSNNSARGSKTMINHSSTGEASGFVKKEPTTQHRVHVQHVNNSSQIDHSHSQVDQSGSENKIFSGVSNVRLRGHGKEKKQSSSKGRPYSPSEGSTGADESTRPVNADSLNKQHVSSDFRRSNSQNSRLGTNRESRADWNQERHGQTAHFEYQPVGPYNSNTAEIFEDASNNMGSRYKDRGQSHPKRDKGNFHRRQSGGNVPS